MAASRCSSAGVTVTEMEGARYDAAVTVTGAGDSEVQVTYY